MRSPGRNGLPSGLLLSLGGVGREFVGWPATPVVILPPTTEAGPSTVIWPTSGDVFDPGVTGCWSGIGVGVVAIVGVVKSGGLVGVSGVDKFVALFWPVVVVGVLLELLVMIAFSKPGDDGVDGGFSLCGDSGNWLWLESSSIDEILPCA